MFSRKLIAVINAEFSLSQKLKSLQWDRRTKRKAIPVLITDNLYIQLSSYVITVCEFGLRCRQCSLVEGRV